jgi:hypothetical protein
MSAPPENPVGQRERVDLLPWALKYTWTCTPGMPGTDPWGLRSKTWTSFTQTSLPDRGLIPEVQRRASPLSRKLILFATLLLAQSLPRKRFFSPALLARLHVEAVLLYFLNDVFLLHLPLKATERVLKRLTLLNDYFCQCNSPQFRFELDDCSTPVRMGTTPKLLSHEVAGFL